MKCIKKGEYMRVIVNRYDNRKGFENVLWHGGTVATIEFDDKGKYAIIARGIVSCKLIAKKDFILREEIEETDDYQESKYNEFSYKKGDIVASVKDKNEYGLFYSEMKNFIKNDEHLVSILTDNDENYELEIYNNNWLELSYYNPEGEIEYDIDLDEADICDAIKTVMKEARKQEKIERKKYSIYCRTALYSEDAIQNQINYNVNKLKLKYPELTEKDINIYVDNDFSGLDLSNPAFSYLLEDLKSNNMKDIFMTSIDRISRNILNVIEAHNILKDLDVDMYCSKENIYLKDVVPSIKHIVFPDISHDIELERDY